MVKNTSIKKVWQKWKKLSNKLLDKEASIILTFLYWTLIPPFAILSKFFSNPLNIYSKKSSFWFEKRSDNVKSLEEMKKQY